jgi:hypothetical protein
MFSSFSHPLHYWHFPLCNCCRRLFCAQWDIEEHPWPLSTERQVHFPKSCENQLGQMKLGRQTHTYLRTIDLLICILRVISCVKPFIANFKKINMPNHKIWHSYLVAYYAVSNDVQSCIRIIPSILLNFEKRYITWSNSSFVKCSSICVLMHSSSRKIDPNPVVIFE